MNACIMLQKETDELNFILPNFDDDRDKNIFEKLEKHALLLFFPRYDS
jgi:hypothetical protein